MKVYFIVNPAAGNGRGVNLIPFIEDICKNKKINYHIKETSCPGDASDLAREAIKEGADRIVSVGGDGTLNEVLNGMAGSGADLGIIPAGTGNDFIRSVNRKKDIKDVINDAIEGHARHVDLGKCNSAYFINVSSGGFDAEVVACAHRIKKYAGGSKAYFLALIRTIFAYEGRQMYVDIDGKVFEKNILLVAVANGRYYGGGIKPAPKAEIDDGLLEVCILEKMPKIKMLLLFHKYIRGKHEGVKGVSFYRGKSVKLRSREEFPVNVDGEVSFSKEVDFNIIHKGVNVVFPVNE